MSASSAEPTLEAMHRTDAPGNLSGQFSDGNPYGTPPTGGAIVSAAWLNDVQENLSQAIEAANLELEKGNGAQLLEAIKALAADNYFRGRECIAQARTNVSALDLFGIGSPTIAGTPAAASSAGGNGPTVELASSGTSPETIGWTWAFDLTKRAWIPDFEATVETAFATNSRLWVGLFSAAPDLLTDPAAIKCAAFRFEAGVDDVGAGGDGTIKSVTSSGSGSIVKSTGITFASVTRYRLRIRRHPTTLTTFQFFVDGVLVSEHVGASPTSDPVPGSADLIGPAVLLRHLSDAIVKKLRLGWLRLRSK